MGCDVEGAGAGGSIWIVVLDEEGAGPKITGRLGREAGSLVSQAFIINKISKTNQ
jgi:hypothetical protein